MKKKKPLLTISLLSSGREKTIKKCLDSLVPLMEKVDCELIIVDTGCNEEVKKLMSEYTDKFVPFTWCDDFSKARNAGLRQATGEWFLYIDDDEWFLDTKEIEDFFLTGEYKKYFYACYNQRNYMRYDRKLYTDAWVSRMVRLDKGVKFVSMIHEYFSPLYDPCKLLHCTVEHFGYIYESKEEERKHIRRNIVLLLKMIEKEKNTIRWWTHLLQEYRAAEEFQKMEELAKDGLEHFKDFDDLEINRERGALYCGMAEAQVLSAYYERAERTIKKALKDKRNNQMCQMRLYNLLAEVFFKQENYAEAEKSCEKYVEFYNLFKDDEDARMQQEAIFVMYAFTAMGKGSAFCYYILCGLYRNDTTILKKYFWELDWDGTLMLYRGFVNEVIDAMSHLPYEEEFVRMAETMTGRVGFREPWDKLLAMEQKKNSSDEKEREQFYRVARIFSQVSTFNHYTWYLKILYADYAGEQVDWNEYYENMFHYVTDIFQLDDIVFTIAEKNHVNLGPQFEKIPFDQWKLGIDAFFTNSDYKKILNRAQFVTNTLSVYEEEMISEKLAVRRDYFYMKLAEATVIFGTDGRFDTFQENFRSFSDKCLAFYRQFYKDNAFEGEMELLTQPCRAAVRLRNLLQAYERGDRQEISACLKAAVGVFPSFDPIIKMYTKLYVEMEKEKLETETVSPEMRALGEQIKGKLRILLDQNMTAEAYQVLEQLKTFIPGDQELVLLEEEIQKKFS